MRGLSISSIDIVEDESLVTPFYYMRYRPWKERMLNMFSMNPFVSEVEVCDYIPSQKVYVISTPEYKRIVGHPEVIQRMSELAILTKFATKG